jgi:RNA polymerase sigma factor (TIGR02999 family)
MEHGSSTKEFLMTLNRPAVMIKKNAHVAAPKAHSNGATARDRQGPIVVNRIKSSSAAGAIEPNRNRQAMSEISQTLDAIDRGEPLAASQLLPLVYDELRKLAAQKLAQEKPGQTLDPTGLVHEAYLRLVDAGSAGSTRTGDPGWANRRHFFAAAAEAMRRILVENARRKGREKHGGGRHRENADLDALSACGCPDDIVALHEALEQFALRDPQKAKLVELRYFGGLTLEQAAACLEISLSTADRAWRYSRAWLYAAMAEADSDEK